MRAPIAGTLCVALALALALGAAACARPPRPNYAFENQPGGWRLDDHDELAGMRRDRYVHDVHPERLEIYEVDAAAPAADAAGFTALAQNARRLPTLGEPTATPRALGDESIAGASGFWVEQHGRVDGDMVQGAAYVVPNGRRYYVVRMFARDDEVEQLRGWVRDLVLRNLRFPRPRR